MANLEVTLEVTLSALLSVANRKKNLVNNNIFPRLEGPNSLKKNIISYLSLNHASNPIPIKQQKTSLENH